MLLSVLSQRETNVPSAEAANRETDREALLVKPFHGQSGPCSGTSIIYELIT